MPVPGQYDNHSSDVVHNNNITSDPMGFNQLPHLKGEKVAVPVVFSSAQAPANFSQDTARSEKMTNQSVVCMSELI